MRRFSSTGPLDKDIEYYAPREDLINKVYDQLVGEDFNKGGHYITIWGSRQTGKTWTLHQTLFRLNVDERFSVVYIGLEHLKSQADVLKIIKSITSEITYSLKVSSIEINELDDFQKVFKYDVLDKPMILILDEFDALNEEAINKIVGMFRNIYISRKGELDKPVEEKTYQLHGVALIGVRSVLGIENQTGSPFNVQRSVKIPNLTYQEVDRLFKWYEEESGQTIAQAVIDRIYYETQGQPGLTCWLGEVLTDICNKDKDKPITMDNFKRAYLNATQLLYSSHILNLISKAKTEPYKDLVLELFRTDEKMDFTYDDDHINYLYMNGIIDIDEVNDEGVGKLYVKFASPFVHKRLFNHFSRQLFRSLYALYEPFEDISDTITEDRINVRNLVMRYNVYLRKNKDWLLKDAPRRSDLRIYEAVFHFNLYMYLYKFIGNKGEVYPEFPTGNGKIDLIIKYRGQMYGIEIKSYTDNVSYHAALEKAAIYGQQLELSEISLVFFVESIDDENRRRYEVDYMDEKTGVKVMPVFVALSPS